jgi:ATP-binding protein involved in chromosome partitioning
MTMLNEGAVTAALKDVQDPELGKSLLDLRMIDQIRVTGGDSVTVKIDLPTHAYPKRERVSEAIQIALRAKLPEAKNVNVEFSVKTKGKDTGGSLGLRVKNVVAVGSGKGGVGKSTIAASIAYGLHLLGAKVGLLDADVYGPSIPHMMGVNQRPAIEEKAGPNGQKINRIQPIEKDGLKIMSMGFVVPPEQAVVWRGPMLHQALTQFLKDTEWGELDYLIIDMPPGTGDVSLTLSQLLGLAGAVVVCTPQQVALLDAVKAISMFRTVKIPVLGIVENMSGEIFGRGGAKQKAAEMNLPFLGEVPIDASLRINGDQGRIVDNFAENNPARGPLLSICEQVAMQIVRELASGPAMPTLEIL